MCRPRIAARQLLHRFVLNADPFLPDIRRFLDSRLYWPRVFHIRHDCFCADRKAADSAAADVILSQGLWLGAGYVRPAYAFTQPRIHEISTGENHEISAFNCSNNGVDERDIDLVERGRLLRWRRLLPRRLLYHNDPIIRVN